MLTSRHDRFTLLLGIFFSLLVALPLWAQEVDGVDAVWDPIEPVNRGIFWFNDKFDRYIFEPVAEGYAAVLPVCVRHKVSNVFENLRFPTRFLASAIELDGEQALRHTGRFLINTTIGVGGLFDVASEIGLDARENDLGSALAYQGVPAGPYLVLPFLGPSTLRDGVGTGVSGLIDPVTLVAFSTASDRDAYAITFGAAALDGLNTRARLLEAVRAAREASLDYYLFMQSAYFQYRDAMVTGKTAIGQKVLDSPSGTITDEDDDSWMDEDDDFALTPSDIEVASARSAGGVTFEEYLGGKY